MIFFLRHLTPPSAQLGDRLVDMIYECEAALPAGVIEKEAAPNPFTGQPTFVQDLSGPFSHYAGCLPLAAKALRERDGKDSLAAATMELKVRFQRLGNESAFASKSSNASFSQAMMLDRQYDEVHALARNLLRKNPDYLYAHHVLSIQNADILESLKHARLVSSLDRSCCYSY